jgi:ABC-type bacteriocin/lantibiotic exporter with double-glycine peptidase domain
MRHVLETDLPDMQRRGPGEYLHQMQAIGRLRDFNNGYAATAIIDLCFIPLFLACILYVAGPLVIVPAGGLMFVALLSLAQGMRLRRRLHARDRADDRRYDFLIETLGALHTLKSLTLEKLFLRRYERLEETSASANFTTAEATAAVFNACTVLSHVMVAGIITLGAVLVIRHDITAGALVATLLLGGRMMQMVQRGLVLAVKYQDARLSRDKVTELFDRNVLQTAPRPAEDRMPVIGGALSVKALRYILPDHTTQLDIAGLQLARGETLCIHGKSGTGKSTLLQIMAGVLRPTAGTVEFDGQPVPLYPAQELARHIGYVNAEPVIFRGTIRHNITRFGDIDALSARRAATQLGIDKDIARLPLGFDTFLQGNISDTIPPGLKQRIAMARVIAATPGILLLDGADMTLDRHGQHLLIEYLRSIQGRITLVIVSDEPAMQALATRRLYLVGGRLQDNPPGKELPA